MEKKRLEVYKSCVKQLLSEYAKQETEHAKIELLFDDERLSYMAVRVGWFYQKRLHLCLVHIDIHDDQIIIQANNTEDPVASNLVKMGVPRKNICLGFIPPEVRRLAEQEKQQGEELTATLLPQMA